MSITRRISCFCRVSQLQYNTGVLRSTKHDAHQTVLTINLGIKIINLYKIPFKILKYLLKTEISENT